MVESLELDRVTGEITITDNSHLDRETKESEYIERTEFKRFSIYLFSAYVMLIDAEDENGKLGFSKSARTRLVINIDDVNDVPPLFKQRKYEGFMSSDLTHLRNNLQVNPNFM